LFTEYDKFDKKVNSLSNDRFRPLNKTPQPEVLSFAPGEKRVTVSAPSFS
jgi:hypothetical protein